MAPWVYFTKSATFGLTAAGGEDPRKRLQKSGAENLNQMATSGHYQENQSSIAYIDPEEKATGTPWNQKGSSQIASQPRHPAHVDWRSCPSLTDRLQRSKRNLEGIIFEREMSFHGACEQYNAFELDIGHRRERREGMLQAIGVQSDDDELDTM
jgi:hypothetical protein